MFSMIQTLVWNSLFSEICHYFTISAVKYRLIHSLPCNRCAPVMRDEIGIIRYLSTLSVLQSTIIKGLQGSVSRVNIDYCSLC